MKPTACYCTTGCGVNGEAANPNGFAYKSPVWPPRRERSEYVGADTICARITVPTVNSVGGRAVLAWLGIAGNVFNHPDMVLKQSPAFGQELTVYTAFTTAQCNQFVELAEGVALSEGTADVSQLRMKLCNSDMCNSPAARLPPTGIKGLIAAEAHFPGKCPMANPNPTGCYCTSGCAWNAEAGGFPWKSPEWPAPAYKPDFVGADTICARITLPILSSQKSVDVVNLAQALWINGDVMNNGSIVRNAPTGSEVTIYTAFTAAQCEQFQEKAALVARKLATRSVTGLGIFLCNTTNCNGIATNRITRV
jgi:hypothetical protein